MKLVPAAEIPSDLLSAFLGRSFGDVKAQFLAEHGTWWHRGEENRWVLTEDDRVAGYCGVIPTRCAVAGEARPALWWMDLVIAPEFRGRGLQTRFDELVKRRNALLLGFPNALAARIHRRHGWGVREDLRSLLLPLAPRRLRVVRRASGGRGWLARAAALAAEPWAALWRGRLRRARTRTARLLEPCFDELAAVAAPARDLRTVTTWRDADYLAWRYGEAPYRSRLLFYGAGGADRPKCVLVARRLGSGTGLVERWLDLFGDLEDRAHLDDLLGLAAREAAEAGVAQVTALASRASLVTSLRHRGFWMGTRARLCWLHDDRETMRTLAASPGHWCLGDSDNDEPGSDGP